MPRCTPAMIVVFACLTLFASARAAARSADVILDPAAQSVSIGSIVEVRITLSGTAGQPQPFDVVDVIFSWDPAVLDLIDASQIGADYLFFVSGFLPNPDGINTNLDDGLAMFTGLGPPGMPQIAPPSPQTKIVTTLRFQTLVRTPETAVTIVPAFGTFSTTRVLLTGTDVTGDIDSTALIAVTTPLPCPAAGSCFAPHPNPGCDDAACCEAVCTLDAFCCTNQWDSTCVDEAFDLCDGCGDPATGDCCSPHDTAFCDNQPCCTLVCADDSFCCDVEWDLLCVDGAAAFPECGCDPCLSSTESCFQPHNSPGCDDPACCAQVCGLDPFCCEVEWDELCKESANEVCGGCGIPAAGSCFCPHPNVGCDNSACCRTVCEIDSFCCEVSWDAICAGEANTFCDCRFDFNNDGVVDGADLGLLLAAWATNACPYDANGDATVDGADLGLLLAAWGPCG